MVYSWVYGFVLLEAICPVRQGVPYMRLNESISTELVFSLVNYQIISALKENQAENRLKFGREDIQWMICSKEVDDQISTLNPRGD
jgi:hypothetical protein